MKKSISGVLLLSFVFSALAGLLLSAGTAAAAAREIVVGVGTDFEPYVFIDANNKPAGYDVAVLKEVNKRLPQYTFVFEPIQLKNLLLSIDSGKVDVASQQFEKNPERESKYLFADEGFSNYDKRIVFRKGRADIKTIDDLAGKKVAAGQGSNTAAILEKYNAAHPGKKIEILYQHGSNQVVYDDIVNGRLDAGVMTRRVFNKLNNSLGGGLEQVTDSLFSKSSAYFVLAKKETRLKADIDKALREIKADGTLSKLSKEYTGGDYTSE
ncbi:amino acid ABC transporter substrate-binding protein [Synergistales bacterium]|nr:amino acid ABC transporter substrate-binding protein [Synergistales bacterium]